MIYHVASTVHDLANAVHDIASTVQDSEPFLFAPRTAKTAPSAKRLYALVLSTP